MTATQPELSAAMRRLVDALQFMRGPTGEVLYVGDKALHMAWHLARAGADVDPDRAVIKPRTVPAGPGQIAGMVDWVSVETPDTDTPGTVTAVGEIPDPATLYNSIPWTVRTKFEGAFT